MNSRNKRAITPRKLSELWEQYAAFRKPQISPSTYSRDYQKIFRRITRMRTAAPFLTNALEIRDWLLQNYSAETSRRSIVQFNSCCKWAMESDLLTTNPFDGIQRHIRPTRPRENAWAAFTVEERDRIIQEFESEHHFYAPWVKILFWTGCRPEEAAALRWEHVAPDCTELYFCESLPVDVHEPQATKNHRTTRFPCNHRLQHLIRSIRPSTVDRSDLVFQARTGGRFNYQNFQTRYWKPTVNGLVDRGLCAFYMSQYHARHTWITEALNHLSVSDVAYLARVSPAVLYKHYAGRSRRILIPEF